MQKEVIEEMVYMETVWPVVSGCFAVIAIYHMDALKQFNLNVRKSMVLAKMKLVQTFYRQHFTKFPDTYLNRHFSSIFKVTSRTIQDYEEKDISSKLEGGMFIDDALFTIILAPSIFVIQTGNILMEVATEFTKEQRSPVHLTQIEYKLVNHLSANLNDVLTQKYYNYSENKISQLQSLPLVLTIANNHQVSSEAANYMLTRFSETVVQNIDENYLSPSELLYNRRQYSQMVYNFGKNVVATVGLSAFALTAPSIVTTVIKSPGAYKSLFTLAAAASDIVGTTDALKSVIGIGKTIGASNVALTVQQSLDNTPAWVMLLKGISSAGQVASKVSKEISTTLTNDDESSSNESTSQVAVATSLVVSASALWDYNGFLGISIADNVNKLTYNAWENMLSPPLLKKLQSYSSIDSPKYNQKVLTDAIRQYSNKACLQKFGYNVCENDYAELGGTPRLIAENMMNFCNQVMNVPKIDAYLKSEQSLLKKLDQSSGEATIALCLNPLSLLSKSSSQLAQTYTGASLRENANINKLLSYLNVNTYDTFKNNEEFNDILLTVIQDQLGYYVKAKSEFLNALNPVISSSLASNNFPVAHLAIGQALVLNKLGTQEFSRVSDLYAKAQVLLRIAPPSTLLNNNNDKELSMNMNSTALVPYGDKIDVSTLSNSKLQATYNNFKQVMLLPNTNNFQTSYQKFEDNLVMQVGQRVAQQVINLCAEYFVKDPEAILKQKAVLDLSNQAAMQSLKMFSNSSGVQAFDNRSENIRAAIAMTSEATRNKKLINATNTLNEKINKTYTTSSKGEGHRDQNYKYVLNATLLLKAAFQLIKQYTFYMLISGIACRVVYKLSVIVIKMYINRAIANKLIQQDKVATQVLSKTVPTVYESLLVGTNTFLSTTEEKIWDLSVFDYRVAEGVWMCTSQQLCNVPKDYYSWKTSVVNTSNEYRNARGITRPTSWIKYFNSSDNAFPDAIMKQFYTYLLYCKVNVNVLESLCVNDLFQNPISVMQLFHVLVSVEHGNTAAQILNEFVQRPNYFAQDDKVFNLLLPRKYDFKESQHLLNKALVLAKSQNTNESDYEKVKKELLVQDYIKFSQEIQRQSVYTFQTQIDMNQFKSKLQFLLEFFHTRESTHHTIRRDSTRINIANKVPSLSPPASFVAQSANKNQISLVKQSLKNQKNGKQIKSKRTKSKPLRKQAK